MQIFRAEQRTTHGQGSFHIERVKPGLAYANSKDPALGPLSGFDHATLGVGTVVKMHEHVNDEILSYMWKGTMLHEDKAGNIIPISRNKLMMMNAGKSFWHEESTFRSSFAPVRPTCRGTYIFWNALKALRSGNGVGSRARKAARHP
jgi:redox-sensitive bicupin YhaK (pirin superfamily)